MSIHQSKNLWITTIVSALGLFVTPGLADTQQAKQILDATGVRGGLIVHIGCGDGKLTSALLINDSYVVHGLDRKPENVDAARKHIKSLGQYGSVSVDLCTGDRLPYIDNSVNLVVSEDLGEVSKTEVMRILVPKGVAYLKLDGRWEKTVKSRPKEIDEWSHYLHDPSNNASPTTASSSRRVDTSGWPGRVTRGSTTTCRVSAQSSQRTEGYSTSSTKRLGHPF